MMAKVIWVVLLLSSSLAIASEKSLVLDLNQVEEHVQQAGRQLMNWEQKYQHYKKTLARLTSEAEQATFPQDQYYAYYQSVKTQAVMLRDLAHDLKSIRTDLKRIQQENLQMQKALSDDQEPLPKDMVEGETNLLQAGMQFDRGKQAEAKLLMLLLQKLATVNAQSQQKERQFLKLNQALKNKARQLLALKRQIKTEVDELRQSTEYDSKLRGASS